MERLAQVGHINNFLGFEVVNPHFNRGNVGRGIGKTAVGLFQNNRRLGLGSGLKADNFGAVVFFENPFLPGNIHNPVAGLVRIAFSQPEVKIDVKFVIIGFDRIDRNIAQVLPQGTVSGVSVLKFGGNNPGFFTGFFVFFTTRGSFFVKLGDFFDRIGRLSRKTVFLASSKYGQSGCISITSAIIMPIGVPQSPK